MRRVQIGFCWQLEYYRKYIELRNRFTAVDELIKSKIDICLLSETKTDEALPSQHFKVNSYRMIRRDLDKFGGGVIFYINSQ